MARNTGPNPQDFNDANDAAGSLFETMRNITQELQQQKQLHAQIKALNAGLTTQLQNQLALYNQINAALQQQLGLHQQIAAATGNTTASMGTYNNQVTQAVNNTNALGTSTQQAASNAGTLSNNMSSAASTSGGLSGLFGKAGGALKGLGGMAKGLGSAFSKMLGPIGQVVSFIQEYLVEAFKMIDDVSGDTAKNLGVSYKDAQGLSARMNETAINAESIFVSTEGLMEAQNELNGMLGTAVEFSGEFASQYTEIKTLTGLSSQAMGRFAQMSLMSGKGLKQTLGAATNEILKINKLGISRKAIEESIGKASNATLLTLKNNPRALASAAYEAKKLGMEIDQVNKIGDSLLDFESSIASELEAELLTGKDLNLERARYAALTGDTATLAREVAQQVGTSAEYGKMNVIQQEALAKSFGMNREQLADMLVQEETLQKVKKAGFEDIDSAQKQYNEDVAKGLTQKQLEAKYADEGLRNQLASASMQERFEAASKRIKELFVQIVEGVMPLLDTLMNIYTNAIQPIVQALSVVLQPVIKAISGIFERLFGLITKSFEKISKYFNGIVGGAFELSDTLTVIGEILGTAIEVAFVGIEATVKFIINTFESIAQVVGGIIKIFKGDFLGGLKDIGLGVVKFILRPIQFIADIAEGVINAIVRGINKIPGVDIPEVDFNFSGALPLAKGGITKGPTNALIGEAGQEAVIPLDQLMRKFDDMTNAIKSGNNITIVLDGVKVGTALKSGKAGYTLQ